MTRLSFRQCFSIRGSVLRIGKSFLHAFLPFSHHLIVLFFGHIVPHRLGLLGQSFGFFCTFFVRHVFSPFPIAFLQLLDSLLQFLITQRCIICITGLPQIVDDRLLFFRISVFIPKLLGIFRKSIDNCLPLFLRSTIPIDYTLCLHACFPSSPFLLAHLLVPAYLRLGDFLPDLRSPFIAHGRNSVVLQLRLLIVNRLQLFFGFRPPLRLALLPMISCKLFLLFIRHGCPLFRPGLLSLLFP